MENRWGGGNSKCACFAAPHAHGDRGDCGTLWVCGCQLFCTGYPPRHRPFAVAVPQNTLMLEATLAGEDHGCVGFVTGLNALEIPGRAARLNHGCNTLTQADIHTVPEREKGVGNHTQPFAPYTQVRHQLPDNFDEFWPSRKTELAGISMNPKLTPVTC